MKGSPTIYLPNRFPNNLHTYRKNIEFDQYSTVWVRGVLGGGRLINRGRTLHSLLFILCLTQAEHVLIRGDRWVNLAEAGPRMAEYLEFLLVIGLVGVHSTLFPELKDYTMRITATFLTMTYFVTLVEQVMINRYKEHTVKRYKYSLVEK